MQIDKQTLDRLLTLNDAQLGELIQKIATEAGIAPGMLGINASNVAAIREALGSATATDIEQYAKLYDTYRKNSRS